MHAFDHFVLEMNLGKEHDLACSEIRAAKVGECANSGRIIKSLRKIALLREVEFLEKLEASLQERCVRDHAIRSVKLVFPETAESAVKKEFKRCFNTEQ